MTVFVGPLHVVAAVLALSGAHKLVDPEGAATAMRAAGLPARLAQGRVLGLVELSVGGAAIAFASRPAAVAVASLYGGFAVFLLALRRRAPETPCACFGANEVPPSALHLVVDGIGAAVAIGAAIGGPLGIGGVLAGAGLLAPAAYLTLVVAGAAILFFGIDALEAARTNHQEIETL